jgi:hypothetical protein
MSIRETEFTPENSEQHHGIHVKDSTVVLSKELEEIAHHPAHATNRFRPKSGLPLAKLNKNVYIITVGSATPKINKG